jgi:3-methyladenine DNA glycosylase AlkD
VTASAEAAALESELRALGTPQRAASEQAYLKSDLEFTGTAVPATRSVIKSWCRARPGLTRGELVTVTRALWARPVFECRMAAVELLDARAALLRAEDAVLIEHLLRTAGTWALVDGLAEHVMGGLTERCPELAATLDRWARDDDFWLRRSAMLALLRPLRHGEGDFERFSRYADQMLEEKEFFIRKAIGWVLRDTAKRRPEMIAAWLAPRAHRASGVTLREAVRPLSADVRERLLASRRGSLFGALRPVHPISFPPAPTALQPLPPGPGVPGHDHDEDDAGDRVPANPGAYVEPVVESGRGHREDENEQQERLRQTPPEPGRQPPALPQPAQRPADPGAAVPEVRADGAGEDQPDDAVNGDRERLEDHRDDPARQQQHVGQPAAPRPTERKAPP